MRDATAAPPAGGGLPGAAAIRSPVASTRAEIEDALSVLQAHKDGWAVLGVAERVVILDELLHDVTGVGERWVAACLAAKGVAAGTLAEAEEWLFVAAMVRAVRLLRQSLSQIRRPGRPRLPGPVRRRADGQVTARVIPQDRWDRVLFRGVTGEVWMEPGVTPEDVLRTPARPERGQRHAPRRAGKVALVLGAGNASMLAAIDLLHKLFVDDQVVALKPNPVNAYLGPLLEEGFRALIRRGVLRVVYGGVAEGAYLCRHPAVDQLHLTGSARTFEAITFGAGAPGRLRKQARAPVTTKPFTCELGNVSPVIVVPGPWSTADLRAWAARLATWLVANAGFGCLTPRLLVQHRAWPLRQALLDAVGQALAGVPTRPAYYPGAGETYAAVVAAHPNARRFGDAPGGHLPWTLIPDVDPANADDLCFTREVFSGVLAETALDAGDTATFVERAVAFANGTLWGTLNATLLVHPASLRDRRVAVAVERAIADLRYGTVLVNAAAFAGYYFQVTPWGGFPGHDPYAVQSGLGKTANLLMFERPQKSVVRGPFRPGFDPIRVTSRRAHAFARRLAAFEASRSLPRAAGLLWSALLA